MDDVKLVDGIKVVDGVKLVMVSRWWMVSTTIKKFVVTRLIRTNLQQPNVDSVSSAA